MRWSGQRQWWKLDYDFAVSIAYLGEGRVFIEPWNIFQSKDSWYMSQGSKICLRGEIWTPKIHTVNARYIDQYSRPQAVFREGS